MAADPLRDALIDRLQEVDDHLNHVRNRLESAEKQRDEAKAKWSESYAMWHDLYDETLDELNAAVAARDEALARVERAERQIEVSERSYVQCNDARAKAVLRATQAEAALRRIANDDVPGDGDWSDCVISFACAALQSDIPESAHSSEIERLAGELEDEAAEIEHGVTYDNLPFPESAIRKTRASAYRSVAKRFRDSLTRGERDG